MCTETVLNCAAFLVSYVYTNSTELCSFPCVLCTLCVLCVQKQYWTVQLSLCLMCTETVLNLSSLPCVLCTLCVLCVQKQYWSCPAFLVSYVYRNSAKPVQPSLCLMCTETVLNCPAFLVSYVYRNSAKPVQPSLCLMCTETVLNCAAFLVSYVYRNSTNLCSFPCVLCVQKQY